jgi:hypothetical protein
MGGRFHHVVDQGLVEGSLWRYSEIMATGTQIAYARKVAWAKDCRPSDADRSTVYVFDASQHDEALTAVREWCGALVEGRDPLTVVISAKVNDSMSMAEHDAFESAVDDLPVYPLSRPAKDTELLAYVSSLLTLTPPVPAPRSYPAAACNEPPVRNINLRQIDLANRID